MIPIYSSADYNIVRIEALALKMSIGIHDHEKKKRQRVLIDINLYSERQNLLALNDQIDGTICYETIINTVTALAQEKHYNLVETFVEDIAALCLKTQRVLHVDIYARKPDIIKNASAVGVQISR